MDLMSGVFVLLQNKNTKEKKMSGVILIIDDEEAVANLISDIFQTNGKKTIKFYNSSKAVEYIETTEEEISFCVVDFEMIDMNGLEFSKHIYKFNPDIPIILISGYSSEDRFSDIEDTNIKEFIQKPLLIDKIKKLLKKYT